MLIALSVWIDCESIGIEKGRQVSNSSEELRFVTTVTAVTTRGISRVQGWNAGKFQPMGVDLRQVRHEQETTRHFSGELWLLIT